VSLDIQQPERHFLLGCGTIRAEEQGGNRIGNRKIPIAGPERRSFSICPAGDLAIANDSQPIAHGIAQESYFFPASAPT
jgi:hypothetical protein